MQKYANICLFFNFLEDRRSSARCRIEKNDKTLYFLTKGRQAWDFSAETCQNLEVFAFTAAGSYHRKGWPLHILQRSSVISRSRSSVHRRSRTFRYLCGKTTPFCAFRLRTASFIFFMTPPFGVVVPIIYVSIWGPVYQVDYK